ncbi:MAG: hypothetical protein FJ284_10285 [Planctomycetes bacterium]|nr:hypothetical protein [Planctomycetota bacterium]
MQSDTDILDYLSRRLTGWDQDLRWGHRGVEQFTMFLEEAVTRSQAGGYGQGGEPDSSARYSSDDLETAVSPEMLAEFRMLATGYLLQIPGLLVALEKFEAMLRAGNR